MPIEWSEPKPGRPFAMYARIGKVKAVVRHVQGAYYIAEAFCPPRALRGEPVEGKEKAKASARLLASRIADELCQDADEIRAALVEMRLGTTLEGAESKPS